MKPMSIRPWRVLCLSLLGGLPGWTLMGPALAEPPATPKYVGREACAPCHEQALSQWRGSHHDLAMAPATDITVLGDFDDQTFTHNGVTTRFFRAEDQFLVETPGLSGDPETFEVAYTFGVTPLQQYLLSVGEGRYQALTVAWDTRPREHGGQRWFHLYPDEDTPPGDELHWLAPAHNWNFACAECHSTNLRKGYAIETDSYETTWSEIDVSCEACHGPGSEHVETARSEGQVSSNGGDSDDPSDHGLVYQLQGRGQWQLQATGNAKLISAGHGASQVEACGRCHARRSQLTDDYRHAQPLSDSHRVTTLLPGFYYPDGQILDEVYVYGSFRQSAMYKAGVVCSDCHEPHSLELRAEGDGLCLTCHAAATFTNAAHHRHSDAAQTPACVDCHMTARTYMQVDPRRDHGFRIPRPDRSVTMGVPNACNQCHRDQTASWAAQALDQWFGKDRAEGRQDFAEAFHRAVEGAPGAGRGLREVIGEPDAPAIARATAFDLLPTYALPEDLQRIAAGLTDKDALVRVAAAGALVGADAQTRQAMLMPLLDDPVNGVRLAAAENLIDLRPEQLGEGQGERLRKALENYEASQRFNADRAEHWVNLGALYGAQGDVARAEQAYREALKRNQGYVPAYANWADLYRGLERDAEAEQVLVRGLEARPEAAPLHHAVGLLMVRQQKSRIAVAALGRAYQLAPENARFGYVYGVALETYGQPEKAIAIWKSVLEQHPNDQPTLQSLVNAQVQQGEAAAALDTARRLLRLQPDNQRLRSFIQQLAPQLEQHRRSSSESSATQGGRGG